MNYYYQHKYIILVYSLMKEKINCQKIKAAIMIMNFYSFTTRQSSNEYMKV